MTNERLNEHDANQGAQSSGEFLGMTGNSAWYLLGSAGASILLVILLWGILGFSLLVCLGLGITLCALALAYVFALKNDRPEHYDTDFFESTLVEAGVLAMAFGPREKRPHNPFGATVVATDSAAAESADRAVAATRSRAATPATAVQNNRAGIAITNQARGKPPHQTDEVPVVPLTAYERLRDELNATEDALEDALASGEEEGVCG